MRGENQIIQAQLKVHKQAHVSQYYSNSKFPMGSYGSFFIGRFQGNKDSYRSFLYFHIESLSDANFKRVQQNVFLRLFVDRNEVKRGLSIYKLFRLKAEWEPASLTWNNQPVFNQEPEILFSVPAGWQGFLLLDISRLFNEWVYHEQQNYGLMLQGDEKRDCLISFHGESYYYPNTGPMVIIGAEKRVQF